MSIVPGSSGALAPGFRPQDAKPDPPLGALVSGGVHRSDDESVEARLQGPAVEPPAEVERVQALRSAVLEHDPAQPRVADAPRAATVARSRRHAPAADASPSRPP